MNTSDTHVTRERAAELARVHVRTISRWSAAGYVSVRRPPTGSHDPALYLVADVLRMAEKLGRAEKETGIWT